MTTIPERVAAGAAFLDEQDPDWWREGVGRAIDLDWLLMASGDRCILGQRCPLELRSVSAAHHESYYATWVKLLADAGDMLSIENWAVKRGFQAGTDYDDDDNEIDVGYGELGAEWKRVIIARREVPGD